MALRDVDGLEAANANLMGRIGFTWDDERTLARDAPRRTGAGGVPRSRARLKRPVE